MKINNNLCKYIEISEIHENLKKIKKCNESPHMTRSQPGIEQGSWDSTIVSAQLAAVVTGPAVLKKIRFIAIESPIQLTAFESPFQLIDIELPIDTKVFAH